MQATHPERLNGRLLTERTQLTVQLTKEGKVSSGKGWKHEEHTRRDQTDHNSAPNCVSTLDPLDANSLERFRCLPTQVKMRLSDPV